jgi:dihydrofolate reductase
MRKIVVSIAVSVDGFFEGPNREIDWHRVDEELHSHMNEMLGAMSAFIHGRVTYDLMAAVWPTADSNPEFADSPAMVEFARIWRDMPKIVYSRSLDHADWNSTVKHEVDPEEIRALQQQPGGDMVIGGPDLVQSFRELDLIDEYRIYVHPVLLGRGRPLFGPADTSTDLGLVESRTFGNGVVLMHYERRRTG